MDIPTWQCKGTNEHACIGDMARISSYNQVGNPLVSKQSKQTTTVVAFGISKLQDYSSESFSKV